MTLEQQLLKLKCIDEMGNIINYTGYMNCLNAKEHELEKQLQFCSTEEGGIKNSSMRYEVNSIFNQLEQILQLKKCTHTIKAEPILGRENLESDLKPKYHFVLNLLKRVKQKLR